MSILHKQLLTADILPGMVLSDNLLDAQGQILLPGGATLTQQTIDSMRRHNVASARIVIGEMSAQEMLTQQQHAQARLARLFRRTGDNEINNLLHRYVLHFRSEWVK